MSVLIGPGWTELHLMFSDANRPAVDLVRILTAPLDAAYAGEDSGRPTMPAIEEIFTIDPPPALCIAGTAYLIPKNTPLELISIVRSQSSEETSR